MGNLRSQFATSKVNINLKGLGLLVVNLEKNDQNLRSQFVTSNKKNKVKENKQKDRKCLL